MKKINLLLILVLVVFSSFGYTTKSTPESVRMKSEFNNESKSNIAIKTNLLMPSIYGDVNGDGVVDIEDMIICDNEVTSSCSESCQADLNNDGFVDATDLSILSNLLCSYL